MKSLRILFVIFACAILFLVVAVVVYFFQFNEGLGLSHKPADWGTFGDYLGGILNPLFGLLSLIALLVTIILQKQELDSTKSEIKATREDEEKKRIETSIFQMFSFLSGLCEKITCYSATSNDVDRKPYNGKEALIELYFELHRHHNKELALVLKQGHKVNGYSNKERIFSKVLANFWCSDGRKIVHYFRFIKQFIKRIDSNSIIDRSFYLNLLKSQLLNDELCLFAYYCLWQNDPELTGLVDKWEFFNTVQPSSLIDECHQGKFQGAFGCPF